MKRFLLGSASVAAVMLGLSGTASAQVVDIGDIGAAIGGLGALVDLDALNDIDIAALNGLAILPEGTGVNGVYLNTAVNVAPQLATNVNLAAPLDVTGTAGLGGLIAAVGVAISPDTASGAVAVDLSGVDDIIASVGSDIVTRDMTATAVGVLANQANQNVATTIASLTDTSTLTITGGTLDLTDEATQAAATAGSASSSAAARFTDLSVTGPSADAVNNIVSNSISGALPGVYAANTALNIAPQIAANINAATDITTRDLAATAAGTIATQVNSIGLDGAAITSALSGNFAGTAE